MKKKNIKFGYSIPFSNEGAGVTRFLDTLKKNIVNESYIVVCLTDKKTSKKTIKSLNKFVKTNKFFYILNVKSNNFTMTRVQGIRYLLTYNCDFYFDLDGNGSHDPRFIKNYKKLLMQKNFDAVFGSRFKNYKKSFIGKKNFKRIIISFLAVKLSNMILKAKFTDSGGFVSFSKILAKKIVKHKFFSPGHFFHYELKYLLKDTNYFETPITYKKSGSKLSYSAIFNALKSLIFIFLMKFK